MIRTDKTRNTLFAAPSAVAAPLLGLALLLTESDRCGSLVGV